jgi:hypothetical protein
MPRTRAQLEKAAAEATDWLDNLDPDDPSVTVEDTAARGRPGPGRHSGLGGQPGRYGRRRAGERKELGASKQAAMRRFGQTSDSRKVG